MNRLQYFVLSRTVVSRLTLTRDMNVYDITAVPRSTAPGSRF